MKMIKYDDLSLKKYCESLQIVSALSGLFSDSDIPLINYRATENIYCQSFDAINLSRYDISIDAKYDNIGIGIKTFIQKENGSFQKIAEFNKDQAVISSLYGLGMIIKISELRNIRLEFARNTYGLNRLIYHCIARDSTGLHIFEEEMTNIDVNSICIIDQNKSIITFTDGLEMYKYNISKSTLYKRFVLKNVIADINVVVMDDPLTTLRRISGLKEGEIEVRERLIIPLYSQESGNKKVFEHSGLNQWNAKGRVRNLNEVYIPFPSFLRAEFDGFFPDRNTSFIVNLPNGRKINMKVCQQDGKAIMSNPNKDLGEWLLRDILKLKEGTLVTYQILLEIGIDSVEFEKIGFKNEYNLNFSSIGSFERFLDDYSDL